MSHARNAEAAYERGWARCAVCGTNQPDRALTQPTEDGQRVCTDLVWCRRQKRPRKQIERGGR